MPIKHFPPPAGIKAPPLSFATRVGDLLFISGIPGFDVNGDLPDGFEAQFANVVINIRRVLDEAGATVRDLAKVNVLLTRAGDVATMNKLYAEAFGPAPYPARTTCVVVSLPNPAICTSISSRKYDTFPTRSTVELRDHAYPAPSASDSPSTSPPGPRSKSWSA